MRGSGMSDRLVIGVDFGSASVRATVIECATGRELSCGVAEYPRWKAGLYQHPDNHIFRQHPLDYLESLEACVTEALSGITASDRHRRGYHGFNARSGGRRREAALPAPTVRGARKRHVLPLEGSQRGR